jgi:hypothetical protein
MTSKMDRPLPFTANSLFNICLPEVVETASGSFEALQLACEDPVSGARSRSTGRSSDRHCDVHRHGLV